MAHGTRRIAHGTWRLAHMAHGAWRTALGARKRCPERAAPGSGRLPGRAGTDGLTRSDARLDRVPPRRKR
eukprot:4093437-Prymnesium_polylepis.1